MNENSAGYRMLWPSTLIALGITALSGIYIGSGLSGLRSVAPLVRAVGLVIFIAYTFVVLFVREDFLIAIVDYVPSLLFMGLGFLLAYRRLRKALLLVGFSGTCLMLISAALQQAKVGISARYFGYNALYHALQAMALWMIFFSTRKDTLEGMSKND
jgi:hypothetical protein